ncbi:hypothetical protein CALVIDRAFT_558751 [Calocera viscosa TUFC12733]|uniref:G protein-coupled receptor 89 n=1 Tax=Calocera viscosa (strain TUFC12733) TaxID=1330018 RepID=A0A167GB64_CALVF|nr:hypothetical protein CALVIDRAFT_558751 [Calocera viscosa TUFC12733]
MSFPALVIDTAVCLLVRAGGFYICRRFLLQTIYSDLRHISDATPAASLSTTLQTPTHLVPERSLSRASSVEELPLLPLPASANGESGWTWRRPPSAVGGAGSGSVDITGDGAGGGRMAFIEKTIETAASQLTHSNVARGVFGTVFAETCTLFVLVLFQATGILHEAGRVMNFQGSLLASSLLIMLACPVLELHLLASRSGVKSRSRPSLALLAITVLLPFVLYVLLLFQIPLPAQVLTPTLFDSFLARLILLGVIILSVLSALASVHAVHMLALTLRPMPPPKQGDIAGLEHSVSRLRSDLGERTREQERLSEARGEEGLWGKVFGSAAREDRALNAEIGAMRVLEDKMGRELDAMRERRARIEYSKTLRGRIWNVVTTLFGVYCAFRILSVISNVILPLLLTPRSSTTRPEWNVPDIITYILALAVAHLPFIEEGNVDVQLLGRQISLILVGVVVGGNVRLMMRNVARALTVTSRNMLASFLLLILTQIMGMYLLSTLVQLRSSVPSSSPNSEEPLFALLPRFEVFGRIFDLSFFATCVGWGLWRTGRWLWIEG